MVDEALNPTDPESTKELKLLNEQKIIEHFEKRVKQGASTCQKYWESAEENHKFVRGGSAQWEDEDLKIRKLSKRPTFSINDTVLATNAIAGRETTARYQPDFLGRSDADAGWADAIKEFSRKIRDRCDAEQEESDKFRDMGIESIGWLEWRQNMVEPPLGVGRTEVEGIPIWEMIWDITADKRNLKNRMWDARGRWITYEEFAAFFPEEKDKVREIVEENAFSITNVDQKTHRWPWLYVGKGQANDLQRKEVFIAEYHWKERRMKYLVDFETGQVDEQGNPVIESEIIDKEDFDKMLDELDESDMVDGEVPFDYEPIPAWQLRKAFIVGKYVFGVADIPYENWPRQPITAYPFKQRDKTLFFGWVELMKDPQRFKNLITSMAVTILQHLPKGKTYYEPGAFKNPKQAAAHGAMPGAYIQTLPGALNPGYPKIKEEKPGQFPTFLDAYLGMAEQAVWRPVGLTPQSLGQMPDMRRVSGNVFQSVQDSISAILSYLFDSLRLYRKISGRLTIEMMIAHYEWDDVVRIIGEEKAYEVIEQPNPETGELEKVRTGELLLPEKDRWDEMAEFDVIVEEKATSQSQQKEFWEFMTRTDMVGRWVENGLMPLKIAVKAMPFITEAEKREWIQEIDAQKAAAAAQQQMMEQPGGMPQQ